MYNMIEFKLFGDPAYQGESTWGLIIMVFPWRRRRTVPNPDSPVPEAPAESSLTLRLPFPPIAENGAALAQLFHDSVLEIDGVDLDYSAASLEWVDGFLQQHHDEGLTIANFAETVFVAGCYVGEVMCRQAGGRWVDRDALDPHGAGLLGMPILVALSNDSTANPVGKAFKRFEGDSTDNLMYFYRVFTSDDVAHA